MDDYKMKLSTKSVILSLIFFAASALTAPAFAGEQDKRWVHFAEGRTSARDYYYDQETVAYLSNNRVSVWMKVVSQPTREETSRVEIECSGTAFRTIEPGKPTRGQTLSTASIEYGWAEIPPDSEIQALKKRVCKPR